MKGNQCWNISPEGNFDSHLSFINDSEWNIFDCPIEPGDNSVGWCNQNTFPDKILHGLPQFWEELKEEKLRWWQAAPQWLCPFTH